MYQHFPKDGWLDIREDFDKHLQVGVEPVDFILISFDCDMLRVGQIIRRLVRIGLALEIP